MRGRAFIIFLLLLLPTTPARGKVLPFSEVFQEQSQWCWAAVSRSLLLYYGHDKSQCTIAEYSRQVATYLNFGKVDCCKDPSQGCNIWNYCSGTPGSIEDILNHYGTLGAKGIEQPVTDAEVDSEINTHGRPFVVNWLLTSGSGHFVVAHGLTNGILAYMNPSPGEGKTVGKLSWVRNGGGHTWRHTVYITSKCRCTKKGQCCDGCTYLKDGAVCSDGDLCTEADGCSSGVCKGTKKLCLSSNPCEGPGTCQGATGSCKHPLFSDGAACPGGTCRQGLCVLTHDDGPKDGAVDAGPDAGTKPGGDRGCALSPSPASDAPNWSLRLLLILLILLRRRPS